MGEDEDSALAAVTQTNHATHTLTAIYKLYQCQKLCDMTLLVADNVTFTVHRVVLIASSQYFKTCLSTDEEKHFESVPNISSSAMNILLDFMYTGTLSVDQSNVWHLLAAATQLQVSVVVELCQNYLKQQVVWKENSEVHSACSIAFHGDVENVKTLMQEDNENRLFPVVCAIDSGEKNKAQNWLDAAESEICSKEHTYNHIDEPQQRIVSCVSVSDNIRQETTDAVVGQAAGSDKPMTQVSTQEMETTTQYFDVTSSSEFDDGASESVTAVPLAGSSYASTTGGTQIMKKATHIVKRKSVVRKMMFMCKFCMKEFRYCSAKKLHVRLNHTYQSNLLRLHFSWQFLRDNIPKTIEMTLPSGAVQHGCIACNAQYTVKSLYRAHFYKIHHVSFRCHNCDKTFQSRKLLMIHRVCSHKVAPAVGRLLCSTCHRPFIHRHVFASHRCSRNLRVTGKKHKNKTCKSKNYVKSKFLLVCPYCSQSFCYRKSFMNHMARRHNCGKLTMERSRQRGGKSNSKYAENNKNIECHVVKQRKRAAAKIWRCEEGCDLVISTHAELRTHMKQQHPLLMFQCSHCNYQTQVGRMMARHNRLKHGNNREKICDICGKEFSKPSLCRNHKYLKHDVDNPSVKVYYCDVPGCKYRTCQICNLKVHKARHNGDRDFVCSTCGKKLKTAQSLKQHVEKVHLNIRPFICDKCGQAYGAARELDSHLIRHSAEKKYKCEHCDYATHAKTDYLSHMFAIHKVVVSGRNIFQCSVCDYATDRRGRMRDHEICHKGIRSFCCTQCDKRFMTRPTLLEHIRCMHTPKTMRCNHCAYVSSTRRHLVEHIRVMHTYRDVRPYQCVYCNYRSTISGNCRKHCKNKHRGMPVKWVKVCEKYPERCDSLAVTPSGEHVPPSNDIEPTDVLSDIHKTVVPAEVSTKVCHPVKAQNTLSVS